MGLDIFGTSNYSNPQWIPEPNGRGTWGLIQTCLLTLGLCVYSAIHLNVFHRQCRWWTRLSIRLKWLVVALLAPEFIVYNAWSQRRQAVRIARMLRRRCGQKEPVPLILNLWTYLWPRARITDPEGPKDQPKQPNKHASGPDQTWDGKASLSPCGQQSPKVSKPQEQDTTEKSNVVKSIEIPVKVRSTTV